MKIHLNFKLPIAISVLIFAFSLAIVDCYAQDSTEAPVVKRAYVNSTFAGNLIIDNQTVMVPVKGTVEFSIQHRFGTVNKGYDDFYGIFAPANIRLGMNYTPIENLQLGIGVCKERMQWDGTAKYAILRQAKSGGSPVSVTFFGDMSISTLPSEGNFVNDADRISYFSQLIIARKFNSHLSVQISPSLSYFNNIPGYLNSDGNVAPAMENAHWAISVAARYKVTDATSIIINYDQPLTQHPMNNPHPNVSFGVEMSTIGHSFQMFFGNYQSIIPQQNNVFNQNDYTQGAYVIGFNITRRWYRSSEK